MLVQASLSCGFPELSILTIMVSIATFVVFVKTFYSMFLKPKPNDLNVDNMEVPKAMVFAMFVLLVVIFTFGLFPDVATKGISNYVGGMLL